MKRIVAAVLCLASLPLHAADGKVHVGTLIQASNRSIALSEGPQTVSIGFTADPDALRALEQVRIGSEVRAVFGTAPGAEGRRINKLLTIRECPSQDAQCAKDRQRQEVEAAELGRKVELAGQEHARCHQAMEATLAKDPRYVPESRATGLVDPTARFNALTPAQRTCGNALLQQHQDAYLEACNLHHCGDNVGGGCAHLAGYAITQAVLEQAARTCGR